MAKILSPIHFQDAIFEDKGDQRYMHMDGSSYIVYQHECLGMFITNLGDVKTKALHLVVDTHHKMEDKKSWVVLARDIGEDTPAKMYGCAHLSIVEKIKQDWNLYEVIPNDLPVRLFADFDCIPKDGQAEEMFNTSIEFVIDELAREAVRMTPETFGGGVYRTVCTAHRDGKFSAHIASDVMFENMRSLKQFIQWATKHSNVSDLMNMLGLDMAVYGNNQCVRMLFQTKAGKPYPLTATKYKRVKDHLIGVYNDNEDDLTLVNPSIPNALLTAVFAPKNLNPEEDQETIKMCLAKLDSGNYDTWIRTGMIIKNKLGDDGFPLWDEWSKQAGNYDGSTISKWHTFDENGTAGVGSLVAMVREKDSNFLKKETLPKLTMMKEEDEPEVVVESAQEGTAEYFNTGENPFAPNSYDYVKYEFERECFKVKQPVCFVIRTSDGKQDYISEDKLKTTYRDWSYVGQEEVKVKGQTVKIDGKKNFIKRWLCDPNKRMYETMGFDPSRTCGKNVYNTFRPFRAEKLPPVDDDREQELVKPITNHIDVLMRERDVTMFIIKWMASIVQRPWFRTMVAILLHGKQGAGKNTVFDFFNMCVIGEHLCKQTADPHSDLFEKHSNGHLYKLFIQIDEVKGKDMIGNNDKLKNLITAPKMRYEHKGTMTIDVPNLANLIFTTNNENPIPISFDDRRFVAIQCTDTLVNNHEYFTELHAYLKRDDVARAFYQYLMKVDISDISNFQAIRPLTSYYQELQRLNLSPIDRFISWWVVNGFASTCKANEFYSEYRQWANSRNFTVDITGTMFGRKIKQVGGITAKRAEKGIVYTLEMGKVEEWMKTNNRWDDEVF